MPKYDVTIFESTIYRVEAESPQDAEDFIFDQLRLFGVDDEGREHWHYIIGGETSHVVVEDAHD